MFGVISRLPRVILTVSTFVPLERSREPVSRNTLLKRGYDFRMFHPHNNPSCPVMAE